MISPMMQVKEYTYHGDGCVKCYVCGSVTMTRGLRDGYDRAQSHLQDHHSDVWYGRDLPSMEIEVLDHVGPIGYVEARRRFGYDILFWEGRRLPRRWKS